MNICTSYTSILKQFNEYIAVNNTEDLLSGLYGASIRLVFHDAGEVLLSSKTDKLGPDGCLSQSSDNAGLIESTSEVQFILEPIWQTVCDKISRADFWVLFAKLVIEQADNTHVIKIPFQFGRKDNVACDYGVGRLPNAQLGTDAIQKTFVQQMGLTLDDAGFYY
jgi:catalase (peroxidase I)